MHSSIFHKSLEQYSGKLECGRIYELFLIPHSYILQYSTKVLNNIVETLWKNGLWKNICILPHYIFM